MEVNRKSAMFVGDDFYNTGKPCKNGHMSYRKTLTSMCMGCIGYYKVIDAEKFKIAKLNKKAG